VARAVAEQIRLKLTPEEQAALTTSRTVDPRAYDAYLRGLQLRGPLFLAGVWSPPVIEQLERAVELDPEFAEGWAALAAAYARLGLVFSPHHRGQFAKARETAERALEIDDHLGEAHSTLGLIHLWYDWDFTGARRAFDRSLQLSPSDPTVLERYAWYLLLVEGKTTEGIDVIEEVLRVAPFDLYWRGRRVEYFVQARQPERALEEVERIRMLEPDFVSLGVFLTYLALGRFEEAHRALIDFYELCGPSCDWAREATERGWAEGGTEGRIRAWLEAATEREGVPPTMIAINFAGIGKTDQALASLERGYRERDSGMIFLKASPGYDPLRSDPRYHDLLRRIGFPEE
jgi:tetratricopeptide (TPR) repeat protein